MTAVQEGLLTKIAAASLYNIPRTTLLEHLKTGSTSKRRKGSKPLLSREQEKELVDIIVQFSKITPKLIRRQAFIFCEKHKIQHNFDKSSGVAGRGWLALFLKRNPEVLNFNIKIQVRRFKKDPIKIRLTRCRWTEENLRAAMAAVQEGQLTTIAAASLYNIPRTTLLRHLKTGNTSRRIGSKPLMSREQEKELVDIIGQFSKITPKLIRRQAFIFCEKHKIPHNFDKSSGVAGRRWLELFLKRNPEALNFNIKNTSSSVQER